MKYIYCNWKYYEKKHTLTMHIMQIHVRSCYPTCKVVWFISYIRYLYSNKCLELIISIKTDEISQNKNISLIQMKTLDILPTHTYRRFRFRWWCTSPPPACCSFPSFAVPTEKGSLGFRGAERQDCPSSLTSCGY